MIPKDAFRDQPTLTTERLRLEQLGPQHYDDYWAMLQDQESARLTGTHGRHDPDFLRGWLTDRINQHDRCDWAIIRKDDDAFIGDTALLQLDPPNKSMVFRICLIVANQGFGTEVLRRIVDYAFDEVGLHRLGLDVFDFNPRAKHVYEKLGFVEEGRLRHSLLWDGEWHDSILMSILATDRCS